MGFPVRTYESSAFRDTLASPIAVSVASLMHPIAKVIGNAVDERLWPVPTRVWEAVVPCGGTGFKLYARRVGGKALATSRALSTGCLRKAAQMIPISFVRAGR